MAQLEEASGFVERARERILDHAETRRQAGLTDRIYAVVQSEAGTSTTAFRSNRRWIGSIFAHGE